MSYTITDFTAGFITVVSDTNKTYVMRVPVNTSGVYITGDLLSSFIIDEMHKMDLRAVAEKTLAASAAPILELVVKPPVVTPPVVTPDIAHEIRVKRTRLLCKCDWCMVSDAIADPAVKAEWVTYRQALRNLTTQPGFPSTIVWPVPPATITGGDFEPLTNPDGSPTEALNKKPKNPLV